MVGISMDMTVGELASIPDFRIQVLAGASGLRRTIRWAHVCELSEPTEWLSEGELLMTVGFSIPEDRSAQAALVKRLAERGLSGLLICDQAHAPVLSASMLSAADRCSLPVLLAAYEVPFTAISRTVAEANRSVEHTQLLQVLRLYETVRLTMGDASGLDLTGQLADRVGCDLFILDPDRGCPILNDTPTVPEEIAVTLTREAAHRSQPMPAILRLREAPRPAAALHIPASRSAVLVAVARGPALPNVFVLHHVAAIAALKVERLVAECERKRRLGTELLASLIDGRIDPHYAVHLLSEQRLLERPVVLACCTEDSDAGEHCNLHLRLGDRGIPHLLLRRAPLLTALLPNTPEATAALRKEVDSSSPVGLSAPVATVSRVPDAHREAQWALRGAKSAGTSVCRYGENPAFSPFLPRNLSEADHAVREVLGALLDYDATHESRLVESLRTFLRHNRSWQKAAESLHVHKQTLVYRMRRVEELTGRRLDQTKDVAEFWLALRALEASGNRLPD